jgi:hypothetical protein
MPEKIGTGARRAALRACFPTTRHCLKLFILLALFVQKVAKFSAQRQQATVSPFPFLPPAEQSFKTSGEIAYPDETNAWRHASADVTATTS